MKEILLLFIKSKISVLTLKQDFSNIGNKSFILYFPRVKANDIFLCILKITFHLFYCVPTLVCYI